MFFSNSYSFIEFVDLYFLNSGNNNLKIYIYKVN